MRKFTKNIVKEFKNGFARFLSIMAIIALGVGFLIGVMQATPNMKNTMDNFYTAHNASDITVKGTYGLTEGDVEDIRNLATVRAVMPVISTDVQVAVNEKEVIANMVGADIGSSDAMNKLTVERGRLPKRNSNEVVAVRESTDFESIEIGTKITLEPTVSTYKDVYAQTTFTVVGIVSSPDYYYTDAHETTPLGSGRLGTVLYGYPEDIYNLQKKGSLFAMMNLSVLGDKAVDIAWTDCWVQIEGADKYQHFYDDYKTFVRDKADSLKTLGKTNSEKINTLLDFMESMGGEGVSFADADWYVLDRAQTNISYVSFNLNVEKVEDIAGIFPIFFILVAALVALTSMTRMVEEDRMQIGTFKALGYSGGKIVSKYIIYCCLASIIGCLVGILCGFSLLPSVFWQAYSTMYTLPKLQLGFSWQFALAVFAVAIAGTTLVTLYACWNSLKERPSSLMQPKAPKAGKRILLERIGFLWNPMKFKWKATVRNIFRYKKNMILTIVSVMGCTALIVTGFGLNDSVTAVTDLQFNKILQYDAIVEYSGDLADADTALRSFIGDASQEGENYLSFYKESGKLTFGGENSGSESADLYVVENSAEFQSFIDLHESKNSAIIDLTTQETNGIVLPANVAQAYDIAEGDTVRFRRAGSREHEFTVLAVCENYTGSTAFVSRSGYESAVGPLPAHNTLLVKSDATQAESEQIVKEILADNSKEDAKLQVRTVTFKYESRAMFDGLGSTMGLIIAVLVISAGGLAAIVLYNLTNINIDERRREIATLRVLGYRKGEVAGYIYRESALLTTAGALLGLGLGWLLHRFIIRRVDSVAMMFGKSIFGLSYLWAFLLTAVFAAIIYGFMLIKLNKIDMADSLKSNE